MGALLYLPIDITTDEAAFGFAIRCIEDGTCAIAAELGDGLLAVKVRAPDGSVAYQVCDRDLEQLYATARSLAELVQRFAPRRARA